MATPIKDRIRSAAIAYPGFTALLGTNPFRWYDQQLVQGSAFPAVVVSLISQVDIDAIVGRMPMIFTRVQFTIWSVNTPTGMASLASIEALLKDFVDSLNLVGISGLCSYSNRVVSSRDGWFPRPEPGNPQRLIDAMVYANESL